jgi:hypothetical protein
MILGFECSVSIFEGGNRREKEKKKEGDQKREGR